MLTELLELKSELDEKVKQKKSAIKRLANMIDHQKKLIYETINQIKTVEPVYSMGVDIAKYALNCNIAEYQRNKTKLIKQFPPILKELHKLKNQAHALNLVIREITKNSRASQYE